MDRIIEYRETELTLDVATAIAELAARSFKSSGAPVEERVAKMLAAAGSDEPEITTGRRFVIWDDERAVAHARTFVRVVSVGQQDIPVLALASVCTRPDVRGRGLGVEVTKKAFQQVGQPGWPEVSLFQTPVAPFYEKLNSRVVTNRFVNGRNSTDPEANPWRDDTVMIFPVEYHWPAGTVDLNGPDY